jgi:hypothetical protein
MGAGAVRPLLVTTAVLLTVAAASPDALPEQYEPRTFLGYACADDCERHKAGFGWAEVRAIVAAGDCDWLPGAAAEGCRVHAELSVGAEEAGYRWATENELTDPCLCAGAGERFESGCLRAIPWFAISRHSPAPGRGCDAPRRFDPAVPAGKLRR